MVDGERWANFYHSCSAATTAPAFTLQGNTTHTYPHVHTQVPAQHYYPLNLTCPLNSISLFIYSKWCVALCLPTSLHLSLCFSLPADCPGGDWWELWWDEAGCAHVSLSHVPGPAVSWTHPSGSGSAGRGNMHTQTYAHTAPPACCQCTEANAAQGVVGLKTTCAILICLLCDAYSISAVGCVCEWHPCWELSAMLSEYLTTVFSFIFNDIWVEKALQQRFFGCTLTPEPKFFILWEDFMLCAKVV